MFTDRHRTDNKGTCSNQYTIMHRQFNYIHDRVDISSARCQYKLETTCCHSLKKLLIVSDTHFQHNFPASEHLKSVNHGDVLKNVTKQPAERCHAPVQCATLKLDIFRCRNVLLYVKYSRLLQLPKAQISPLSLLVKELTMWHNF